MLDWNRFLAKVSNLFWPDRAEQELTREIESHVALIEEDLRAEGMTPDNARIAAARAYGNVAQVKQLHREERSFLWIGQIARRSGTWVRRHLPGGYRRRS